MQKVMNYIRDYYGVVTVIIMICAILSYSLSNFFVTSENHKAAEMYIGELKYSINLGGLDASTITVPSGEEFLSINVKNLNGAATKYKLVFENNPNIDIVYYSSTEDVSGTVTTYSKAGDSIALNSTNTIRVKIKNNATSKQGIAFKVIGGYDTNSVSSISVPSGYSEIPEETEKYYFCYSGSLLKSGITYSSGQYEYKYKYAAIAPTAANNGVVRWSGTELTADGWGVQAKNPTVTTDSFDGKICSYIDDKPIITAQYMYAKRGEKGSIKISNFKTSNITDMSYMFQNTSVASIDLGTLDTSNVTNMYMMFSSTKATKITGLDKFDTSNVTDMRYMFNSSSVTTLDLSNFNTSKLTSLYGMFMNSSVENLNVSSFDTSNVKSLAYAFYGTKVTRLDLTNFNTSNVTNTLNTFNSMTNLKTIYVGDNFTMSKVTTSSNMFTGSTNLVGQAGTKYSSANVDKTYARLDQGTSTPGYFSTKPNFETDSWSVISTLVKAGRGEEYIVGSTKTVSLGTLGTHTVRLANNTTPDECSTSGFSQTACGFVLEFADVITSHNINSSSTNSGGWPSSSARTYINSTIYNALPTELQNVITSTTVVSGHGSGSTSNFTSTDKLYLLSTAEIWAQGTSSTITRDTARDQTRQLDYYKEQGVTTNNYKAAIKKSSSATSIWWTRTAYSSNTTTFFGVSAAGTNASYSASYSRGISPAFRIG